MGGALIMGGGALIMGGVLGEFVGRLIMGAANYEGGAN